jgi:hypothetical protein
MTIYDIGDKINVTTAVTVDGVPTDATMAISLTAPDGTSSIPTPINTTGVGLYNANFTATMAGNYVVTWTSSGAAVGVDQYQVYVQPAGAKILGLGEVRTHLNINSTDQDNELKGYIEAVGVVVENIVGSVLPRTVTESYDGGQETIPLRHWPIVSVTSVKETWYGGATYSLTQIDLTAGTPAGQFNYTFDPNTGTITRRIGVFETCFMPGSDNIQITYVVGLPQPWPANIRLGALELVSWFWRTTQQGRGFPRPQPGGAATTLIAGYHVPNPIIQTLLVGNELPPMVGA